jgi:AcrR family transcriptional regulator
MHTPKTMPPKKIAAKIAEVALRLLENKGAEAVSMRRVAKAVGITPMAIYHHFPGREALLKAITDAEFDKLLAFAEARISRRRSGAPLMDMMDGYLDYAVARPRVFDYVFSKPRPDARRFPKDFRARRSPTLNLIADAVAQGMKCGELREDDIWEVAMSIWAHVHGCVALYRGGRFDLSERQFRQIYRRSLCRLMNGLQAEQKISKSRIHHEGNFS